MGFDPYNFSLKIWESIGSPTPKVRVHLGVWSFNSYTLPYFQPHGNMKCDSRASLLTRTFASLCFNREPEARVETMRTSELHPHFVVYVKNLAKNVIFKKNQIHLQIVDLVLEFYKSPWCIYHPNQFHWFGHGSSHVKHKSPNHTFTRRPTPYVNN